MESERNFQSGVCHECSTKDGDSTEKQVYKCELCGEWFCKLHLEPKFPYFVDWETICDVQGNPQVKALFHTEYRRKDGHPDFIYLQKTVNGDIGQPNNELRRLQFEIATRGKKMVTYENYFNNEFTVPKEVYSNRAYREKLNLANTFNQVNGIVLEYYNSGRKIKRHWWK